MGLASCDYMETTIKAGNNPHGQLPMERECSAAWIQPAFHFLNSRKCLLPSAATGPPRCGVAPESKSACRSLFAHPPAPPHHSLAFQTENDCPAWQSHCQQQKGERERAGEGRKKKKKEEKKGLWWYKTDPCSNGAG